MSAVALIIIRVPFRDLKKGRRSLNRATAPRPHARHDAISKKNRKTIPKKSQKEYEVGTHEASISRHAASRARLRASGEARGRVDDRPPRVATRGVVSPFRPPVPPLESRHHRPRARSRPSRCRLEEQRRERVLDARASLLRDGTERGTGGNFRETPQGLRSPQRVGVVVWTPPCRPLPALTRTRPRCTCTSKDSRRSSGTWKRSSRRRTSLASTVREATRYESLTTEQLAYARELYDLAAEAGHPGAMYRLGLAYGRGRGAPQSDEKALQWYEKSADYAEDHELKAAAATNAGTDALGVGRFPA